MNQNSLFLILAAPACAWVAGMGLFKTLFMMVIMQRWIAGGNFSGPMEILGSDAVLYAVGALGAIELIIDMFPRLDIQWHRYNGHLRILGAVCLSWFILHNEDVLSKIIMAIVGAALAATSFTATTSARKAAIRGRTSAFVSPISSITEDCLIAATLLPLTKLPPMTLLMIAFMTMAAMLIMYVIRNETRETLAWLCGGPWVQPFPESESGEAQDSIAT